MKFEEDSWADQLWATACLFAENCGTFVRLLLGAASIAAIVAVLAFIFKSLLQ